MQLTKITLKNYGVYRDKVEFDLSTTPEKPVVLIGGTNGAGKTTLFDSVLLGLYGQSFFDKKTTRKEYERFLANKIHRYLGTTASADSTSIIIDFKFFHNGVIEDYTVDRTWKNDDSRIIEELKIKKNGRRLDSVEESQWQSFIEELIPKGIAKLFFFDGEKIVKIAKEEREDIEIKSSFDSLLGLDLVEQLHSDLRVHIMRNMKDNAKVIQAEYDKYLSERQEMQDDIFSLEDKIAQKQGQLDKIEKEIEGFEAKISKIGGGFASKREELKAKKSFLEMQKTSLEGDLRAIISGPLPLCIIPDKVKQLKSQIDSDKNITKTRLEKEILDERFNQIQDIIQSETFWKNYDIDSQSKEDLIQNISKLFKTSTLEDKKPLLDLSPSESDSILNLLSELDSVYLPQAKNITLEYNKIVDELGRIDSALVNAPRDDELGPLITKLNSLHENQGILKNEIEHLQQQISTKRTYIKLLNSKLRNIVADKYKDKNAKTQAELASRVQDVLDEYIERLKIKKLALLEEYLLNEIQRLMHKENLITKVSVDKETFEITLYDKDKNPFPKDLLSEGEKQMFATAVLLALAKTSGKPLPFMIDTPLARLDVGHRDNLIEKFFPYASHQVVIFSTDSEIDAKYYSKMRPYISRSYAMEYLPAKGKTKQYGHYFWDENGVKIVAV